MKTLLDFVNYNARYNWAMWSHLVAALLFGKALIWLNVDYLVCIWIVAAGSVFWELVELVIENRLFSAKWPLVVVAIEKNYGSVRNWWFDAIGDVLIAVFGVVVLVI